MERNLTTTIKVSKGSIRVVCLEKISTNIVEIFNDVKWTSNPLEQTRFIKQSIAEINTKIAGEINSVIAVVESNKKTNLEINMLNKGMSLPSSFVTKKDVENVIALAERDGYIEDKKVILVQPVKFTVNDITSKSYNKAPINQKGHKLSVRVAISTISFKVYQYVKDIISSAGLEILQVLTDTHIFAQETISASALLEGAISVHTGMKRMTITINANSAVVSSTELKLGFNDLIKAVSQQFNCSFEVALNLIKVHGDMYGDNSDIIYTSNQGVRIISYTLEHLSKIIKQFMTKIIEFSQKYIDRYEAFKKLSVTLSGEVSDIKGIIPFAKTIFTSEYIQVYKPLTFIAMNSKNLETIAIINLIDRIDKVIGKTFNTIVMTNPNSIEIFKDLKESKLTRFFGNILGARYARTTQ